MKLYKTIIPITIAVTLLAYSNCAKKDSGSSKPNTNAAQKCDFELVEQLTEYVCKDDEKCVSYCEENYPNYFDQQKENYCMSNPGSGQCVSYGKEKAEARQRRLECLDRTLESKEYVQKECSN